MTLYTIGHSTRTIAEFVALLQQVAVETVVDVRAFPRSQTIGSTRCPSRRHASTQQLAGRIEWWPNELDPPVASQS